MNVAKSIHQREVTLEHLVQRVDEVLESAKIRDVLREINEVHLGDGLNRTLDTLRESVD